MNTGYSVTIERGGKSIFNCSVEADAVIEIIRALHLGGALAGAAPRAAEVANVTSNQKGCSECGSPSRHKRECSKGSRFKLPKTGKRRRGDPCPECESISSRHKLGCSRANSSKETGNEAWAALEREEKARKGLMTQRQYDQVKTAHNHGMDPTSIAHEMGLTVKEVNTAILSKTFESYSA